MRLQQLQKEKQFRRILNFSPKVNLYQPDERKRLSQRQALRGSLQIDSQIAKYAEGRHPLTLADRKLIRMLSPQRIEEENIQNFLSYDDLPIKQLIKLSAYPMATQLFLGLFSQILDLEEVVDPVNLEPLKLPTGNSSIAVFLGDLLESSLSIWSKLDKIMTEYAGSQPILNILKQRIVRPLLEFQLKVIKKFNYLIDKGTFMQTFMNQRSLKMTDKATILGMQQKAVRGRMLQLNQIDYPNGNQFINQHGKYMLYLSRTEYLASLEKRPKESFFARQPPNEVNKGVVQNIKTSQQKISQSRIKKN